MPTESEFNRMYRDSQRLRETFATDPDFPPPPPASVSRPQSVETHTCPSEWVTSEELIRQWRGSSANAVPVSNPITSSNTTRSTEMPSSSSSANPWSNVTGLGRDFRDSYYAYFTGSARLNYSGSPLDYVGTKVRTQLTEGDGPVMGVELEVSTIIPPYRFLSTTSLPFAVYKSDASINSEEFGNEGFEIVTLPSSLSRHKEEWNHIFEAVPEESDQVSQSLNTCNGLHVHIGENSFVNNRHREDYLRFFLARELYLPHFLFSHRTFGSYASSYCQMCDESMTNLKKMRGRNFRSYTLRSRNAPRLCVTSGKRTVEVRLFQSIYNQAYVEGCLEYVAAAFDFTAEENSLKNRDAEAIWNAFRTFVFSNEKYEMAQQMFLSVPELDADSNLLLENFSNTISEEEQEKINKVLQSHAEWNALHRLILNTEHGFDQLPGADEFAGSEEYRYVESEIRNTLYGACDAVELSDYESLIYAIKTLDIAKYFLDKTSLHFEVREIPRKKNAYGVYRAQMKEVPVFEEDTDRRSLLDKKKKFKETLKKLSKVKRTCTLKAKPKPVLEPDEQTESLGTPLFSA